jgi:hypothetical protein
MSVEMTGFGTNLPRRPGCRRVRFLGWTCRAGGGLAGLILTLFFHRSREVYGRLDRGEHVMRNHHPLLL